MAKFTYTGQHSMVFIEHGEIEPGDVIEVLDDNVDRFQFRSDFQIVDEDTFKKPQTNKDKDVTAKDQSKGTATDQPILAGSAASVDIGAQVIKASNP